MYEVAGSLPAEARSAKVGNPVPATNLKINSLQILKLAVFKQKQSPVIDNPDSTNALFVQGLPLLRRQFARRNEKFVWALWTVND
jgi:hypothetical protein